MAGASEHHPYPRQCFSTVKHIHGIADYICVAAIELICHFVE